MGEFDVALKPVAAACEKAMETAAVVCAGEAMKVRTPGGVFRVRWDEGGSATAMGQLAFFAEYLEATGLFERWVESCPLKYTSPNAPKVVDVLGTWMLSILDGHRRYAHVGVLRGDGVAPGILGILGMSKIIGDDSLRRALANIAPAPNAKHTSEQKAAQEAQLARAMQWMREQIRHSIEQATATAWILDCDTTIKTLYGKQEGAVVSYNPHKRGRPSHAIHTDWIANLRLVLDAQLEPGNRHTPAHGRPGLLALLESLPPGHRPTLVRGDIAFGSEGEMSALEHIGQLYRDRADCENGFDEAKNQWGWGGYSTHDIERCALSARAVALLYNWWSWYVRLAHPKTRLEAITSRPKPLNAVGRMTSHSGQQRILLSITHEAADQIKRLVANIREGLNQVLKNAPQLDKAQRWYALVQYIVIRILASNPRTAPPVLSFATG